MSRRYSLAAVVELKCCRSQEGRRHNSVRTRLFLQWRFPALLASWCNRQIRELGRLMPKNCFSRLLASLASFLRAQIFRAQPVLLQSPKCATICLLENPRPPAEAPLLLLLLFGANMPAPSSSVRSEAEAIASLVPLPLPLLLLLFLPPHCSRA